MQLQWHEALQGSISRQGQMRAVPDLLGSRGGWRSGGAVRRDMWRWSAYCSLAFIQDLKVLVIIEGYRSLR